VGVIGCGGRGTGAALNVLRAATRVVYPRKGYHTEDAASSAAIRAQNVKVVALADLFKDRLEACRAQIAKVGMPIAEDHCFVGFDAYKALLAVPEVNYVILATPSHFHPPHLRAAVEAGKHVFMEKPAGVDGPGIRSVMESGEIAKRKGLGIVAGTQRRHQLNYVETVKRLRDGAVGDIVECRAYWNGGTIWYVDREPGWSDMEWQCRNWNYYTWLSGDHVVEQHVHNLDVIHWVVGGHPIKAVGMGGRQARGGREHGHIYDHFAVEFEYPSGMRLFSQCRQMEGCTNLVGEEVVGTRGTSNCVNRIVAGSQEWRYEGPNPNPYEQEHIDLIDSIRAGKPLNEAQAAAESTLIGILGRVSAYTGRTITWDEVLNSKQDLSPPNYAFGDLAFPEVPIPGKYQFE
jgi:predicted dehydrogenase